MPARLFLGGFSRDGGFAPLARLQAGEVPFANVGANQAQGGMADGSGHPADLAIAALSQGEGNPGGRDALALADRRVALPDDGVQAGDLGGERGAIVENNAGCKAFQRGIRGDSLDLYPVSLGLLAGWVCNLVLEPAGVRQEDEALAVIIEPARRRRPLSGCSRQESVSSRSRP